MVLLVDDVEEAAIPLSTFADDADVAARSRCAFMLFHEPIYRVRIALF